MELFPVLAEVCFCSFCFIFVGFHLRWHGGVLRLALQPLSNSDPAGYMFSPCLVRFVYRCSGFLQYSKFVHGRLIDDFKVCWVVCSSVLILPRTGDLCRVYPTSGTIFSFTGQNTYIQIYMLHGLSLLSFILLIVVVLYFYHANVKSFIDIYLLKCAFMMMISLRSFSLLFLTKKLKKD